MSNPMPSDNEIVEAMARGMHRAKEPYERDMAYVGGLYEFDGRLETVIDGDVDLTALARSALAAQRAMGLVCVPVEPSEAMLDASWKQTGESKEMRARTHAHYARHYRAMIAAAQQGKNNDRHA